MIDSFAKKIFNNKSRREKIKKNEKKSVKKRNI